MNINFPIESAVVKRYSVRNYSEEKVKGETKDQILAFIDKLENPFGEKVKFHYLSSQDMGDKKALGTYGVIKGANQYIGTTIEDGPRSLEALGYELETAILYLAHLGIGTCWLGGTFNREGFAGAMDIAENEMFPIITPYGYPASRKHLQETVMRKAIAADKRKDWSELFYKNNFQTSFAKEEAGDLEFPLEMVRLGPSASNKQPWRILIKDKACHFYEYKEPGYSDRFPYDIQRIDMGIAAAHFDHASKEKNLKGYFDVDANPKVQLPENMEYVFSWIKSED